MSVTPSLPQGSTMTLHLLEGDIDGPRIAECRTSPLRVHAAPWERLEALLATDLPSSSPGFYLLTCRNGHRTGVRPGEAGDVRRRLQEHALDPRKHKFEDVFCITTVDARLSKTDVRYLEARCHEVVAASSHAVLQVDKVPPVLNCPPAERTVLETLLRQSRDLLFMAGCRGLDYPRAPLPSEALEHEEEAGLEVVESRGIDPDEHVLSYDNIWCWGHPTPDGGFVVRAGSDIRRRENSALLPAIAERRRRLANLGLLGEMNGVTDRWRLLSNVRVSSPLVAAKMCTGAHVTSRGIWQRMSNAARMVTMERL